MNSCHFQRATLELIGQSECTVMVHLVSPLSDVCFARDDNTLFNRGVIKDRAMIGVGLAQSRRHTFEAFPFNNLR